MVLQVLAEETVENTEVATVVEEDPARVIILNTN